MSFIKKLGQNAAKMGVGAAIDTGAQAVGSLINQAFAEHNRERNFYWNEKAAAAADKRQRQQYQDMYSPKAMLDQYAAAGLSPSLMMSGGQSAVGGNPSATQGQGVQGAYPGMGAINPMAVAEIELMNAQADLLKEEKDTMAGENKRGAAEIENLLLDKGLKQASIRLNIANAELSEINAEEGAMTLQTYIERAYHNTSKAAAEARSAIVKADLDEATFQVSYELAFANFDQTLTNTKLLESEIGVNKAQIKEIAERIRNSQWQTWTMEKEQNRKDAIFELDKAKFEAEIKMWAQEQNIELTKAKMDMVSDLVGYVCNFATCGLSNITKLKQTDMYTQTQKDISSRPKTSHTQNYTIDKKGRKVIRSGKYQKTE